MTWTRPEVSAEDARQQLAIVEWLGLTPDGVAGLTWRVTEETSEKRLWSSPEKTPEPEAVIEFRTVPGVKPNRWTHCARGEDQPLRWTLVLRASELADVIAAGRI
jgi:hypothetical protein